MLTVCVPCASLLLAGHGSEHAEDDSTTAPSAVSNEGGGDNTNTKGKELALM